MGFSMTALERFSAIRSNTTAMRVPEPRADAWTMKPPKTITHTGSGAGQNLRPPVCAPGWPAAARETKTSY